MTAIIGFLFWAVALYFTFIQARDQRRSVLLWVIGALVFTPVLTTVVLLFLPKDKWKF